MGQYINCTVDGHVAIVLLNRPKALNALNPELLGELYDTMKELNEDKTIKVVILTGSGDKAFAAGADIASMSTMTPVEAIAFSKHGQKTMDYISKMRPFVIAAVNGYALGGGCELAMACDMRVASSNAKMGIPEVTLGVLPGFGGTQRLPRLVGLGIAKEMLATGRQVKAEEAKAIGLVNEVVDQTELIAHCLDLAERISKNSTSGIDMGKQAMTAGVELDLDKAMELERNLFALTFATADQKEGMGAFLEKRKANFE